jgi:hypothetical protein
MKGVGMTEPVKLARWYIEETGLGDNPYAVIRQVKTLIEKLSGDVTAARQVMEHHLSDSWRANHQKGVPFILVALPRYVTALGLDEYWAHEEATEGLPPHLVVNAAIAHGRVGASG